MYQFPNWPVFVTRRLSWRRNREAARADINREMNRATAAEIIEVAAKTHYNLRSHLTSYLGTTWRFLPEHLQGMEIGAMKLALRTLHNPDIDKLLDEANQ